MKTFSFLSNALVLISYIQLRSCFADQDKTLIRRSQHQPAPPGGMCHHACDCKGYPRHPFAAKNEDLVSTRNATRAVSSMERNAIAIKIAALRSAKMVYVFLTLMYRYQSTCVLFYSLVITLPFL